MKLAIVFIVSSLFAAGLHAQETQLKPAPVYDNVHRQRIIQRQLMPGDNAAFVSATEPNGNGQLRKLKGANGLSYQFVNLNKHTTATYGGQCIDNPLFHQRLKNYTGLAGR